MTRALLLTITVLLGLCSLAAANSNTFKNQQEDVVLFYNIFKDWIAQSNKQYSVEELAMRFFSWKSNYDFVIEQNSKNLGFKLEMNDYSDLLPEEFSALHLGLDPDLKKATDEDNSSSNGLLGSELAANLAALPNSLDWRKKGAVSAVKNQGKCGGCWAFSAIGALEGLYAINNKKLVELSEQQLIDCSKSYGNFGCNGGLITNALAYTKANGVAPSSGYQYKAKVDTCKQDGNKTAFKNGGYRYVPSNNSFALKAAVARQPVAAGIQASELIVQLFKSGVITANCSATIDHAVLIVGYDTDESGQDYWIIKNSWGPKWGLGGYMNIARGSQNNGAGVCGINKMASYPTL